jgi:hypothetical protein
LTESDSFVNSFVFSRLRTGWRHCWHLGGKPSPAPQLCTLIARRISHQTTQPARQGLFCCALETQTQHGGAEQTRVWHPTTHSGCQGAASIDAVHTQRSSPSSRWAVAATVLQASAAVSRNVVFSSLSCSVVLLLWTARRHGFHGAVFLSRVPSHSGRRSRYRIRLSLSLSLSPGGGARHLQWVGKDSGERRGFAKDDSRPPRTNFQDNPSSFSRINEFIPRAIYSSLSEAIGSATPEAAVRKAIKKHTTEPTGRPSSWSERSFSHLENGRTTSTCAPPSPTIRH